MLSDVEHPQPRAWLITDIEKYAQIKTTTGQGIIPIPDGNAARTFTTWVRLNNIINGISSYYIFQSNEGMIA